MESTSTDIVIIRSLFCRRTHYRQVLFSTTFALPLYVIIETRGTRGGLLESHVLFRERIKTWFKPLQLRNKLLALFYFKNAF